MSRGQDHAPDRAAAGDAGHRAADRQRDDRDAQGHLAARRRSRSSPSCSSRPSQIGAPHLPARSRRRRGHDLVPDRCQRPDGRAVLPRALLRPRLRQRLARARPGAGGCTEAEVLPDERSRSTRRHATSDRPLVHAVNVTKAFHGIEVLKGIDLDVRRGEVVCLIGPSGSGKTTFLRCINQLETIDGGRIWVDGDLMGYADRERHGCTALHRQGDRRPAPRDRHGASSGSTCSRTRPRSRTSSRRRSRSAAPRRRPRTAEAARPARAGRPGRQARRLPRAALRRPAAARRDRPGAGDGAQADALRRADERARPRAGRRGARGHAGPRRRAA